MTRRRAADLARRAAIGGLAATGVAMVAVPLAGLLQRAPWRHLFALLAEPSARTALRLSLVCSLGALAVAAAVGLPLAWVLARTSFPGRRLVRALVTLPMVLPPVVGGVALLYAFGRRGLAGTVLFALTGWRLPFTTGGTILAEAFVSMPFLVVTAEAAFRAADRRFEEAAATLGASPSLRFRRVTLPLVAPALGAGAALTWARALGEFGATITFAGSYEGRTETLPLAIYLLLAKGDEGPAVALSLALLAVSLTVLVGLRDRWLPQVT